MYFGKKLLLATALTLTSLSAGAEIVDGVRQPPLYPQVTKTDLQFDKSLLLFNKASGFFCGANDWKTRASVSENGYRVFVSKHLDAEGAWDGKTVVLKDSVERNGSGVLVNTILMVWAAEDGASWVDWNGQADTLWTITPVGDNWRISASSANPVCNTPDTYYGTQKGNPDETRLFWNLALDKANADWYFVDPAVFATEKEAFEAAMPAYKEAVEIYKVAQILKALLDAAEAGGVDVAAQKAVYLNESATKEELEAAIQAVKDAMASAEENTVTADNPVDKTALIVNPSYDNNNNDGWSGDKPGFQTHTDAEFYQKKFDTYQKIGTAPKGVYALSVQAFYRSGWAADAYRNYKDMTGYDAKLYAVNGTDTVLANVVNPFSEALTEPKGMNESSVEDGGVTYYVPNDMETAEAYFMDGLYNNKVFFASEDGTMTIGMYKKNGDQPAGNWVLYDNWGLKYYGNGADAYTLWLTEVKNAAKDYSALSDEVLVTVGMVEAYQNVISGFVTASNKAEVLAAIAKINEEEAKIEANIAAWKEYQEAIVKGKKIANDESIIGQDKNDLADYLDLESEDILAALTLTTEEVEAETQKLLAMIEAAIKNGITPGTDVTDKYLVNADFEVKDKGWTVKKASGGAVAYGGSSTNQCFEAWNNADFDVYQEVSSAPVGVYEISVQGFYRYMRGANAYNAYLDETAPNDAVNIYVNNRNAHFKSVFDEKVENGQLYEVTKDNPPFVDPDEAYWYPNDMTNGSIAFANGMYKATSFGVVANAGDVLRIGVKGATNQQGDSWAIWDNFKMVYRGTDAEVVKPLLSDVIADLQTTISAGKSVGKSVLANANTVLAAANEALNGSDGKAMFQALCDVLAADEAMKASAALFANLSAKAEELNAAYILSDASEATKAEALALFFEIADGIASGAFEDEDVPGLIEKVDALLIKLAIPADAANASDDNPVDLTKLIKTPGFDDGQGANSVAGWEGTEGYNFGNDDTQKAALALEFYEKIFNINQTITGLPNGTYKVAVSAYYRFGSTDNDYATYKESTIGNAFLYTVAGGDSILVPVCLLASGALEDMGISGTTNISGTELYVPNDMVSATSYFTDLNAYNNEIIVKVTDNKLTIGIRKDVKVGSDWVIMDGWTLTYYGENSTKVPTVDIEGVSNNTEPANVEIFNLNGIKMNSFIKGVNIVKITSADGSVTIKKVNVN